MCRIRLPQLIQGDAKGFLVPSPQKWTLAILAMGKTRHICAQSFLIATPNGPN